MLRNTIYVVEKVSKHNIIHLRSCLDHLESISQLSQCFVYLSTNTKNVSRNPILKRKFDKKEIYLQK